MAETDQTLTGQRRQGPLADLRSTARSASARSRWRRATAVLALLATGVAVATASGWTSQPLSLSDGTAWLFRDGSLFRGSAATGQADWLIDDVVNPGDADQSRVAQDDDLTVVVDSGGEKAFSVDAITLELGESVTADTETVPYVAAGQVYLVSDGLVRWMDPATFTEKARISLPGHIEAAIDADGSLWTVTPRDGLLRRIIDGQIDTEARASEPGQDLTITVAGNRPVILDADTGRVSFVDRRSARPEDPLLVDGAAGGRLQGPSADGTNAWIATETGVIRINAGGEVDVNDHLPGRPLRPEIVGEVVIVPTDSGQVAVLDEATGEELDGSPTSLPAATQDDFVTFVKDGEVWFNSPSSKSAGTIGQDGTVQEIEVDEEGLQDRNNGEVNPNEPLSPEQIGPSVSDQPNVEAPADSPPTDAPADEPPSDEPPADEPPPVTDPPLDLPPEPPVDLPLPTEPPPPPPDRDPEPEPDPAPSTTAADIEVPDVTGRNILEACAQLEGVDLTCQLQASGSYDTPANQVLSQNPSAGAAAGSGDPVSLHYHAEGAVVPAAGLTDYNACDPIEAAGLNCNLIGRRSTTQVLPGQVLGQQPAQGTRVGPGATVNVTHDDHDWAVLYGRFDTTTARTRLSTSSATESLPSDVIGRIFTEEAPGTVALSCWTDGTNYRYTTDGSPSDDFQRCPDQGRTVGYVYPVNGATVPHWYVYRVPTISGGYFVEEEELEGCEPNTNCRDYGILTFLTAPEERVQN